VPQGQQVNNNFPTTVGNYSLLSSSIPRAGTLDELGFPAMEGDQIQKLDTAGQWSTVATYTSGAWTPSVPSVQIGESFLLKSGSSASRTWTQTFSGCAP
jgi:hypothetical protein